MSQAETITSSGQYAGVVNILGGRATIGQRSIQTSLDVHEVVTVGLKARAIGQLAKRYRLENGDFASVFGISTRSFQRRRKLDKLSPQDSDLVWRLATVLYRANEVLGSSEKASSWLQAHNRALAGRKPISLLSTEAGFEEVCDVLGRIEHGVWS